MTPAHPLWRPSQPTTPEEVAAARVGRRARQAVVVVAPDPDWPRRSAEILAVLERVLGDRVLADAHAGSTSVPGM